MSTNWFSEEDINGYENRYLVKEKLYECASPFQKLEVYDTQAFGRMLVLDGYVQTTEVDEFIYHESLVHVPLFLHPTPENVLIIGGGDGGTLRHVLMHPVKKVVMVELDEMVTSVSREHLPSISGDAFDDPRAEVIFDDGAKYVKETDLKFDAILIDSTDPIGPAEVLISPEFYNDCHNAMSGVSVLSAQSGTPFYQGNEFFKLNTNLSSCFGETFNYWSAVPTYPGTLWSFSMAVKGIDPVAASLSEIRPRLSSFEDELQFFDPDYFKGAFHVPKFVKTLKKTGRSPFIR